MSRIVDDVHILRQHSSYYERTVHHLESTQTADADVALREAVEKDDALLKRVGKDAFVTCAQRLQLIPKCALLLSHVMGRIGELDPMASGNAASAGAMAGFLLARPAYLLLTQLPELLWDDVGEESSGTTGVQRHSRAVGALLSQLSDESLLQALADGARLTESHAWRLQTQPQPLIAWKVTCAQLGSMALRSSAGALSIHIKVITNMPTDDGARAAAAGRLAASLQRTQLLPALCSALLTAPDAPGPQQGGVGTVYDHAITLDALCYSLGSLAGLAGDAKNGNDELSAAALVDVLTAPEVQRLLLEGVERVSALEVEAEARGGRMLNAGTGGISGQHDSGHPGGEPGGLDGPASVAAPSLLPVWQAFNCEVAAHWRCNAGEHAAARARWEVLRHALCVWGALGSVLGQRAVHTGLPPLPRLVALFLRLTRASALVPDSIFPGPKEDAQQDGEHIVALHIAGMHVLAFDVIQEPLSAPAAGFEAQALDLLPAALEAWAWSLRAQVQSMRRALAAAPSAGDLGFSSNAALSSTMKLGLHFLQQFDTSLGESCEECRLREELAQRLAGAGLTRTLDSMLRLVAATGDRKLMRLMVSCTQRLAMGLFTPALRVLLSPAASAFLLPPHLPPPLPPAPWDAGRDLGLLLTAAKLLMRYGVTAPPVTGQEPSGHGASQSCTEDLNEAMDLCNMLGHSGLGHCGLPALLPCLEAAGSGASGGGTLGPNAMGILNVTARCAYAVSSAGPPVCMRLMHLLAAVAGEPRPQRQVIAVMGTSTAIAVLAVVRWAARVLPTEVLLAASPLPVLGAAAVVLQDVLERVVGDDGSHGSEHEGEQASGHASMANVNFMVKYVACSLVVTLAELGANAALEPTARSWLLPPPPDDYEGTEDEGGEEEATEASDAATAAGVWWQRPGPVYEDGMHIGFVLEDVRKASAPAARHLRAMQQAAGAAAAGGTGPSAEAAAGLEPPPSPLLAASRAVLDGLGLGLADEKSRALGEEWRTRMPQMTSLPLGPLRRLWPPRHLRVCCNPGCANLEGECEAALKLLKCAGCVVARYCCQACQRAHWRAGHREECAAIKAAVAAAATSAPGAVSCSD